MCQERFCQFPYTQCTRCQFLVFTNEQMPCLHSVGGIELGVTCGSSSRDQEFQLRCPVGSHCGELEPPLGMVEGKPGPHSEALFIRRVNVPTRKGFVSQCAW